MSNLKSFLIIAYLFFSPLFFSIMAALGISYKGSSESSLFIVLNVSLSVLCIIWAYSFFSKQGRLSRTPFIMLFVVPIVLLICFVIDCIKYPEYSSKMFHYIIYFFALSYAPLCIGCYLGKTSSIKALVKWFDVVQLVISLGLVLNIPSILATGYGWTMGGASYQAMSYYGAVAATMNMFIILFADSFETFPFFRAKIWTVIRFICLTIQIVCVFLSGGRGGALLLVVSIVLFLFLYKNFKKTLLILLLGSIGLIVAFSFISRNSELSVLFDNGVSRAFSYITKRGIDMSETSNRDTIYQGSLTLLMNRPILGYGLWGAFFLQEEAYPHNIFIEVMLQGGLVYLFFLLSVGLLCFVKIKKMFTIEKTSYAIIPFLMYPMIMLLFSGTYTQTGLFWFVLSYISCSKVNNRNANDVETRVINSV